MVRYFKDSFTVLNPRGNFWDTQRYIFKRHRLHVPILRFVKPRAKFQVVMVACTKHWNYLFEGISAYVPRHLRWSIFRSHNTFWVGLVLGMFYHHFEARLWKEKIWDKEPGAIIPYRRGFLVRMKNYLLHYIFKPLIYYFGLFIKEDDLDSTIDMAQAGAGRRYRRYLFMEYARRNSLEKYRDKNYDFLEISKMYGKDSI